MRFLSATNTPMEIGANFARGVYTFSSSFNFDQTTLVVSPSRGIAPFIRYFNGTTTTRATMPSGGTAPIGTLIWPLCALDSNQNFTSGVSTPFAISAGTNCTLPASTLSSAMPVPVYIDFESDGTLSTCGARLSVTASTCSITGLNQSGRPSGSNVAMSCPLTIPATYDGCKVKGTISKISSFITASWYLGYVTSGAPTITAAITAVPFDTNWTVSISGSHLPRGLNSEEALYEWSTSCGVSLSGCPNATYSASGTSLKCNFTTPIPEGCRVSVKISRRGLQSANVAVAIAMSAPQVTVPSNQIALSSSPYVLFDIITPDIVVSEVSLQWQLDSCGSLSLANLGLSNGPLSQCQVFGNTANCTLNLSAAVDETCVLRVQVTRFAVTSNNPDVSRFINGAPFGSFPSNQHALANRLIQIEIQGLNLPLPSEAAQFRWISSSGPSVTGGCNSYYISQSQASNRNVTRAFCLTSLFLAGTGPADSAIVQLEIRRHNSSNFFAKALVGSLRIIRNPPDVVAPRSVTPRVASLPTYFTVDITNGISSSLEEADLSESSWTTSGPCSFASRAPATCTYLSATSLNCSLTTPVDFNGETECPLSPIISRLGFAGATQIISRLVPASSTPAVTPAATQYNADAPRYLFISGSNLGSSSDSIAVKLISQAGATCQNAGAQLDCAFVTVLSAQTSLRCLAVLDTVQGCDIAAVVTKNFISSSAVTVGSILLPSPVAQPVVQPVAQPTAHPVAQPAAQPGAQPVVQPLAQPAAQPDSQPVAQPLSTAVPISQPSVQTSEPLATPLAQPSDEPLAEHPTAQQPRSEPTHPPAVQLESPSTATPSSTPQAQTSSEPPASTPVGQPISEPLALTAPSNQQTNGPTRVLNFGLTNRLTGSQQASLRSSIANFVGASANDVALSGNGTTTNKKRATFEVTATLSGQAATGYDRAFSSNIAGATSRLLTSSITADPSLANVIESIDPELVPTPTATQPLTAPVAAAPTLTDNGAVQNSSQYTILGLAVLGAVCGLFIILTVLFVILFARSRKRKETSQSYPTAGAPEVMQNKPALPQSGTAPQRTSQTPKVLERKIAVESSEARTEPSSEEGSDEDGDDQSDDRSEYQSQSNDSSEEERSRSRTSNYSSEHESCDSQRSSSEEEESNEEDSSGSNEAASHSSVQSM